MVMILLIFNYTYSINTYSINEYYRLEWDYTYDELLFKVHVSADFIEG
jgi:hypothetical protein